MKKKWQDDALGKTIPGAAKILVKMKLTLCVILFSFLGAMASESYSQTTKLSLDLKNAKVKDALGAIENQSEFFFLYSEKLIDINREVNIEVRGSTIEKILDKIFEGTNVNYTVKGRQIVLTTPEANNIAGTTSVSQQQKRVTGKVTDTSGASLPGVAVVVKGTTTGVVTDNSGIFSLSNISENSILQFSFVGMTKQEVKVGTQNLINIVMSEETIGLEEVVAIGYGTVKKSNLTGAVSSVKSSELDKSVSSSVGQMLQGKAAGFHVNTISAQPGGGLEFNIRGLASTGIGNEPLIVIDGYPISNSNVDPNASGTYGVGYKNTLLSSINPQDIESIEILKDASATAIYGARAGHGVIMITTKRGKSGKTEIEYNNSFAWQKLDNKPEMLNGPDYMRQVNRVMKERWMFNNMVFPYGTKMLSEVLTPFAPKFSGQEIDGAPNTDWYDEITRIGIIKQHNLSVKSGNEKTKFLFSTNYYSNDGVVKENSFERITGRINLDHKFNQYINSGVSLMLTHISNQNFSSANIAEASDGGLLGNALSFPSSLTVRDQNGKYSINPWNAQMPNPISMLEINNKSTNDRLLINSFLEAEVVKNLKIKGSLGFDRQIGIGKSYLPTTTLFGAKSGGRADQALNDNFNWQFDLTATYSWEINKENNLNFLVGHSRQKFYSEGFNAGNAKFVTDSYLWNNLDQGELERPTVGSYANKSTMASFFGRAMYNYKSKYLVTATLRSDGSSDFAENYKWGLFPSVAAAWRVNQESFMKNVKIVSNLKLRTSWGKTGNSGLGGNALAYYGNSWFPYIFGGVLKTGINLVQLANPNLKWETTTEANAGIDVGLFKNKLSFSIDYFHRVISNLLNYRTLPSYLEINTVAANIGKTQSDGMELTLNTVNIDNKTFSWNTTFTASYYYDRWKERDPNWIPKPWEEYEGAIRLNAGYLSDGLIQIGETISYMPNAKPGQVKLKDVDGFKRDESGNLIYDANSKKPLKTGTPDGVLDEADYVIYNADKPYYLGFSNTFRYKMVDLTIYLYGVLNRKGYNQLGYYMGSGAVTDGLNVLNQTKNSWSHDNTTGTLPSAIGGAYSWGDFTIEDMSFVRVKNITLGITCPRSILPKNITSLRFFAEVTNPFVFTKYSGSDPETDYSFASYPNQKTLSCGLNINF